MADSVHSVNSADEARCVLSSVSRGDSLQLFSQKNKTRNCKLRFLDHCWGCSHYGFFLSHCFSRVDVFNPFSGTL